MNLWDGVAILLVAGLVILAARQIHKQKKKGCQGCCSACAQACPRKREGDGPS